MKMSSNPARLISGDSVRPVWYPDGNRFWYRNKTATGAEWVVVDPIISCGRCSFCKQQMYSLCENSNPNAWMAEKMFGHAASGVFGYSHLTGGFAGGQAEYARVPFAEISTLGKI